MVDKQRIASPRQTCSLEVPGNAEPDTVSIKITNRGNRTLTDVRVNTDRQFGDFHSLDAILESAGVTEVEPTVVNLRKLLRFYVQSRSLGRTALGRAIVDDPVLHTNIANTGMCCYNNGVAALLAQALGFRGCGDASALFGGAHAIAACMMDGAIRLLDIHTAMMLCYRQGSTTELAPLEDVLRPDDRNPYWRIGDAMGLAPDSQKVEDVVEYLRRHGWEPILVKPCVPLNRYVGTTMRMDLRPGESIEWPLRNVSNQGLTNTKNRDYSIESDGGGKWWRPFYCDDDPEYYDVYEEPQMYGNGKIVYEPDLSRECFQEGVLSQFRVQAGTESGGVALLHPVEAGKPAEIIWELNQPYVVVGGRLHGTFRRRSDADWLKVYVTQDIGSLKWCSWGELNWGDPLYEAPRGEEVAMDLAIDDLVCKPLGPMCQRYWVKIVMQAGQNKTDVGIHRIHFGTDFMFDLHSRPHLGRGVNVVTYRDASPENLPRNVAVEFRCVPHNVAPVSLTHSRLEVPGGENALPADGMRYFWVRVCLRDAEGKPICGKKVHLTSSRGGLDEITWMPMPTRDAIPGQPPVCPLVLNQATFKFTNYRARGEPAVPATPEHGIEDWNGYLCFMVQSTTPGESALTATTDDGERIGEVTVRFVR